jgi:hypothetical protein
MEDVLDAEDPITGKINQKKVIRFLVQLVSFYSFYLLTPPYVIYLY